jgi:hypothetical protein
MPAKYIQVSEQKRFYTRGTLRGTRISRLAKTPTLYCICDGDFLELRKGLFIRAA